jgi:preprotein translocase subunit SecA
VTSTRSTTSSKPERKSAYLTHDGIAEAQRVAGVGSFYVDENMDMPHLLEQALRAHAVYERDKDYIVVTRTGRRARAS